MLTVAQPKIAYWAYNYAPHWEAASREVEKLMAEFGQSYDTYLITQNTSSKTLRIKGKHKSLPLPYSLAALPFLSKIASSFHINHLFASPAEPILLSRIGRHNMVLTVTKDTESLKGFEKNIPHLRKLRYIVVESEWHKELLYQVGINSNQVKLIYPGFTAKPYHPASGPFKVLYATSPLHGGHLLSRGVFLMLRAASLLPQVQFILVWREQEYGRLLKLIDEGGLTNVDVRNGFIPDMEHVYRSVHATILPGLIPASLKPAPHSALDSLSHGKPVLVSRPGTLSSLVERSHSGVVFDPTTSSLVTAIHHLMEKYEQYQACCHSALQEYFSEQIFLDRYREVYESMLPGVAAS